MLQEIKTITFGGVNCYLITIDKGFILIDTGFSKNREEIEKELESADCKPGTLKLIVLTHGDFDHSGNCAYLREKYGAKIAMHHADKGMVEHGDLFYNRNVNFLTKALGKIIVFFLRTSLKETDRFISDIYVEDGYDLSTFGFDARVIHIPGHSKGSIGVLTNTGDLFCGDLLQNTKKPAKNAMIVDNEAFDASVEKLKQLKIDTTYPGHGKPFQMEQFIKNQNQLQV
ncbi:MAG: MBL fold metallo-hydrolase [Candidatus Bathyarchaeota archaeon]|nr:MAG: MBL fold metallo-hydrolase [Candidatus Bathyarchaeota archaeon]